MSTGRNRSALSYIPGLSGNSVLKLIIFSSVLYVMFALTWAVIALVWRGDANFNQYFIPNVSLPQLANFSSHWWTLLIYGLFHYPHGFWELLSNMLWLYCFGSVVQMLVGHKQVIPMYLYCLLGGGVFYLLAQLLPGGLGACPPYILGPRAGLVGLAAAAVALTPRYQFYLTETFRVPLLVVAGIFVALMVLGSGYWLPVVFMLLGGGLTGFAYVKLLQAGYRPGEWMYQLTGKVESMVTPNENTMRKKYNIPYNAAPSNRANPRQGVSQKRIDDILDKINQKGYNSLSAEEKEALMRAGKE